MSRRSGCNKIAIKKDPKLWDQIKRKWISSSKGGPAGKNSARKMQFATQEYKRKGGKYAGSRCNNSMNKWTKENWGYVSREGKSRYLPKIVRENLTSREKRKTNRSKGSRKGQKIPYEKEILIKMRKYGILKSRNNSRSRSRTKK